MPTIDTVLAARRQADQDLLRTEELWIERCFEYSSGLLRFLLDAEIATLPQTAARWDRKFVDGVVPEYIVTVTIQRAVFGQFLPLVVRVRAVRDTLVERRLTVTRVEVQSRRNPPEIIIVNGFATEVDLVNYVNDVTVDFNLRQNLVTPPVDPLTPWPEIDLVALTTSLVSTAAHVLYTERYGG
jgi:hypothetical protein